MSNRMPNIVYIMADDMGYGDPGCYGATKIPTPNMDALATEGARFTDVHAPSAVCTPTRYGVLTGRYCWRTWRKSGVNGGFDLPLIDPSRTTVASMLKSRGYATAAVGKWHVGWEWQPREGERVDTTSWPDPGTVDYTKPIIGGPTDLGFDYFFGIAGSLDMPPYCFIENDRTVGLPTEKKENLLPQQKDGWMTPGWRDEQVDVEHADRATAWLERTHREDPDRPFFLYLTPSSPHRPCVAPDFARGASQAGPRGDLVHVVDWVVGRVRETLQRLGALDDTLLVVTSDNGARPYDVDGETYGHASCGRLRGYKSHIWDGGHRVPFIAHWPGHVPSGTTCDETFCLVDMMATFGALTGADLPRWSAEDSFSVLPALLGDKAGRLARPPVVHHSARGMFAIRDGRWKGIFGHGSGGGGNGVDLAGPQDDEHRGQLYDMQEDWQETTNLWGERTDVVERLKTTLQEFKDRNRSRP